jgi:hypothetical protein
MKVFISWSGERSRKVAELLDDWLQCVIQAAEPWMSSKDIDRGALWFTEISDQLAGTGIGIICLTQENKVKPWILFESGALAKGISSNRVCTLLIDLKPTDVENPLAQFNHTKPNRTGLWELVRTINVALKDESLKESILEKVFETYWPQFEKEFKTIIKETPEVELEETRSENDILVELLSSVRGMDRRMRTVENSERHQSNIRESDSNRDRPRAADTERMIIDMLKNNMSPELIQEIMDDRRIPSGFVKKTIERYLKNK